MSKSPYEILGVSPSATQDEIKKAFRSLAHTHHPDKVGGNEEKFKEINAAYQILSDPEKRKSYDQFGSASFGAGGRGAPFSGNGFQVDFSQFGFDDLGDIMGDMFGFSRGRSSKNTRGVDIEIDLDLTFAESIFGVEKEMTITKSVSCERCGGLGGEPDTSMQECRQCDGTGIHVSAQRTILGVMQSKRMCAVCDGRGKIPEKVCTTCKGDGIFSKKVSVRIPVPSGVDNGAIMKMSAQGEARKGSDQGDLFVHIHVKADPRFERHGSTIVSAIEIGFTQAALGDTVPVDTIDGSVQAHIPAGIQHGTHLKLKNKGVPQGGARGDHVVVVKVVTPKKLSREQKRLLEQLHLKQE